MKCMQCGCADSKVLDSRPVDDGLAIRRRRECGSCGRRFTTYEKIETTPLTVIKKDGRRQIFDPDKLRRGIMKATEKRAVSAAQIDKLISEVEAELANLLIQEIPSAQIGELVMKKLKELDGVAYVRFAAVYRRFEDINTFKKQLDELFK